MNTFPIPEQTSQGINLLILAYRSSPLTRLFIRVKKKLIMSKIFVNGLSPFILSAAPEVAFPPPKSTSKRKSRNVTLL